MIAFVASARENIGSEKAARGYKALAASCNPASAQTDLDVNNVRTTLLNGGDMWWNLNDARYEVPKVDPASGSPSVHSLFAGAIWMGGISAGGQLKIAAQTYRQSGNDFWPGPLDDNASVTNDVCNDYNRFWKVSREDIDQHIAAVTQAGGCVSVSQVPESILEWPAKGNIRARGTSGLLPEITGDLAPFFDADQSGHYNPECGDYPVINPDCGTGNVYADQMIFWVYNDKGNIHTETGGEAIGIQVNALAFAFATSDEVNDMTFYRYKLINKATDRINDFYMAQWVDADLGCFNNDYVGCDTSRALGICYNGTDTDPDCATRGYGNDPPLVGVDFFEGPLSDPDSNGFRRQLGMSAFTYYNNDFTVTGNPETAVHFYNYMTGFWKDNTPFTRDQCTAKDGTQPTRYMFPSPPNLSPFPEHWSECSCNNPPADRRFLQSSGPFTLLPGAVNNITVGVVWVRPPAGPHCRDFETAIGTADDKAQALFDNCFKLVDGPDAPTIVIRELDREIILSLVNLPGSNNINESYQEVDPIARAYWETHPEATDTAYKFQGYKIFQLKTAQVSVQELGDVNKARLVAQVDLKDNVTKLVNYTFDKSLNADVPQLMVDGKNEGIRKSFQIKDDLFATGSKALVNHKTYYFAAIAYAYNNYLPYNVGTGEGQKTPYLQGRRNFNKYSAIPNKGESGIILQSKYGDGVICTRLDGTGNGGWNLELTEESVNNILQYNFFGNIEYERGKGPIGVKIFDPMKVKNAHFVLSMKDTVVIDTLSIRGKIDTTYLSPQAYWMLEATTMPEGHIDTFYSETDISKINEQLIREYGISISVNHVGLPGKAPDDFFNRFPPPSQVPDGYIAANGFIEATVSFDDTENRWLTGVKDEGTFDPTNWIRAGMYTGGENDERQNFFDDHSYLYQDEAGRSFLVFYDPNAVFGNVLEGTWAPYCLAANWVNKGLTEADPPKWRTPYTYGPAFLWRVRQRFNKPSPNPAVDSQIPENDLHNLQSVDVVLTSDKSKWTRCVVVELGEDNSLTEGGARKGQIRMAPSWNKDGSYSVSDTGRSWFPGYAINVETGERLNMMFGEDSWLRGENGRDMIWNPTSNLRSPVSGSEPLFGGKHYIYVMTTRYDEGEAIQQAMLAHFNKFSRVQGTGVSNWIDTTALNNLVYSKIMWVSMAMLAQGFQLDPVPPHGTIIPSDVKIRLRVNAPYRRFAVDGGGNQGLPKYAFSTQGLEVKLQQSELLKTACDMIRVVPNPYYAYSAYETSQLDNRVKITNLPNNCTVTIYTLGGTLIRQFNRAIGSDVSEGAVTDANNISSVNIDNSIDWDLKNSKNIPVASGVYLIHVKKEGVCEKVVKWFGVLRPIDLDTF